jgi:FkbM family methyltransferase
MKTVLVNLYIFLLSRKSLIKLNQYLFHLSLRGIGVLNYENDRISGEDSFIKRMAIILQDQVVVDIGANIGDYSNIVASIAPSAKIYAFEPHPITFCTLSKNAKQHNYSSFNSACSDVSGVLKLYDYSDAEGSEHASLHQNVIEEIHQSTSKSWEVAVTTLDTFIEANNIQNVRLLKIDTEGSELAVMKGAQKAITNKMIDVIHFEFNSMNVISKVFFKDIHDLLRGYYFYRMLPNSLLPLGEYNPLSWEIFGYQNIVAINSDFISECKSNLLVS